MAALERPRRLVIMVKAGEPTDAVIEEFAPLLEPGDMIIDGGNAHFADTRRREHDLREQGIHFVGTGVSGGEEGALQRPEHHAGRLRRVVRARSARCWRRSPRRSTDGAPCCTHVGPDGAGHFVKMVHNGIEYADMQLIAEAYDLLRRRGRATPPPQIAEIFRDWNTGRLDSYLIEITAEVLAHVDAATGKPFVDVVRGRRPSRRAPAAGPCRPRSTWASRSPASPRRSSPARLSGDAAQRAAAARPARPDRRDASEADAAAFADRVEQALYASKIVAYAQGFHEIQAAQRGVRLGHRPRRGRRDLARRLHHPGGVPGPHHARRTTRAPDLPSLLSDDVLRRGDRGRPGRLARGSWPPPPSRASRRPASPRRWRTTTACAPSACPPR